MRHRPRFIFQAGRRPIQERRPLPQRGGDPSGGLFPKICDCHKRLDPRVEKTERSGQSFSWCQDVGSTIPPLASGLGYSPPE